MSFNLRANRVAHFTMGIVKKITPHNLDSQLDFSPFLRSCLSRSKTPHQSCHVVQIVLSNPNEPPPPALENEEREGMIVVPKVVLCALERRLFTGIYWSFLLTHPLEGKKTAANVSWGVDPMYDLYLPNNLLMGDRTPSAAAPHWILDMVLGPFQDHTLAIECSEEWVQGTRGKESKRKKAEFLSKIYNVTLYSVSVEPPVSFEEYLTEKAPPCYINRHKELKEMARRKGGLISKKKINSHVPLL
jgi:hypothetical protein